ncbi:MAG TPA: serine hydrolase domain-containing protein, partial [Acidimicrobiales bacterium]|nr:serine hydrolase domain-containing protein [Acidimicrobiales bacterium]
APAMGGREGATLETFVETLADKPLLFHPGTRWFYSVSTDICGRLVEIISGQRFDDYLRTTIFEPLGMRDTGFTVPDESIDRFAANYRRNQAKELVLSDDPQASTYRTPRSFLSGGGGLVSTTEDYLRFTTMLLNGGELDGTRILGRKTVELMSLNHLPGGGELREFATQGTYGETGFEGVGFGLTMAVGLGPVENQAIGSAGEYYWGGAASTIFWIDPAESLVVVLMTQLMPSGTFNFRGQLKSLVYPAIVD